MEAKATTPSPLTSSSSLESFLSPFTAPNSPSFLKLLVPSWWKNCHCWISLLKLPDINRHHSAPPNSCHHHRKFRRTREWKIQELLHLEVDAQGGSSDRRQKHGEDVVHSLKVTGLVYGNKNNDDQAKSNKSAGVRRVLHSKME
ncbi:hypothetical protein PIB30_018470 [Stylosanthes scabra]|uniref:Uncharacterized protein n=1 Tax=Stylosanthes scabra TaxID=79078 RepID=A0ABU6V647_9FABA|nr:hypothetical protein [Stylosanthes scabra]